MIFKTDWKISYNIDKEYIGDYFNVADYQRIMSNLKQLKTLAGLMYPSFDYEAMLDKTYDSYFYAEDINALENNLHTLVKATYPFVIGEKKQYKANDPFITFDELNRIEKGIQLIYEQLTGQYQGAKKLSFTCGGGNIAC